MNRPRLFAVRDWPLSVKLATAVLALAVIPLLLVALIDARELESHSIERETASLERRAAAAARRLEERVGRLRAYVELVATNPTIVGALGDPVGEVQGWDAQHRDIHPLLVSLRQSNAWFSNVYLLDARGVVVSTSERATKPDMIGRPYDYRPYFQAAMEDRAPFVTDVLKNATSEGTAIFVSAPVIADETVMGVVVLKVDTGALHEVVADLAQTGGSALLVDRFGVVVSDAWTGTLRDTADPQSLQFHPFASVSRFNTLFEQTQRYGNPDGDNYLARIRQPLPLERLWNALQQQRPGAAEHAFPNAWDAPAEATMVGYAPVLASSGEPYGYVVLGEPAAAFRGPLRDIAEDALLRFCVVAFVVALVIALLIRRFSRQVVDLATRAQRLAEGEQDTESPLADRRDELGMLARSIQRLAAHVRQAAKRQDDLRAANERARDDAQAIARVRTEAIARAHAALAHAREALADARTDGAAGRRLADRALAGAALDLRALGDEDALVVRAKATDLSALVAQVLEAHADDSPERTVKLTAADDLPAIQADPAMVQRVVEHLVDNACKFTRQGSVQVQIEAAQGGVSLAVVDTGIGITARQAARISGDGDESLGGGGIGLWVCRRLTAAMGATLTARGEVGHGTTVTLWLPATPPTPSEA